MKTVQNLIDKINKQYRNRYTDNDKIEWLNDAIEYVTK